MNSTDLRHILRAPFAEQILYNGVPIWAIATRGDRSNISIKSVNNQSYSYNITIEISSIVIVNNIETLRVVSASKATGDTVRMIDIKGAMKDFHVSEVLKYDGQSNSFKLSLS